MKEIVIFAGTTEGRMLSQWLDERKIYHTVCVATEYGEQVMLEQTSSWTDLHRGRLDREQMKTFLEEKKAEIVVDATHPYASLVTENIRQVCTEACIDYLRLERGEDLIGEDLIVGDSIGTDSIGTDSIGTDSNGGDSIGAELAGENVAEGQRIIRASSDYRIFDTTECCARALAETKGNILLTTGSKELALFCQEETVKNRLYVRVLPGKESIALCEEQQIPGKQIIAMQGPFSEELNLAILHSLNITTLVTKASGRAGGFQEKLSAAEKAGVKVFIIGRPPVEKGDSFEAICRKLESFLQIENTKLPARITLIGCGMEPSTGMTLEAAQKLQQADLLFGASRLLDGVTGNCGIHGNGGSNGSCEEKSRDGIKSRRFYPYYLAKDILPVLLQNEYQNAVILFSGDSGFYSGATSIYQAIKDAISKGDLHAELSICPGISSVSALAAKTGLSWEGANIMSIHGRGSVSSRAGEILDSIRHNRLTFLLLSGASDLQNLGKLLLEQAQEEKQGENQAAMTGDKQEVSRQHRSTPDLAQLRIHMGYRIGYPDEEIAVLSPKQCLNQEKPGLYSIFIENPDWQERPLTFGLPDREFIRDKVPMTKEEVRTVSLSKLRLHAHAVVYDIGSGTGSVAVEMGLISPTITVYAIERGGQALGLISDNIRKFGLTNVHPISGLAPEALLDLPKPTHAFIGGTGGHMKEILALLLEKNPGIRIVANAVSFETLAEIMEAEKSFPIRDFSIVQLAATRTGKIGAYHMNQAENPVWIAAFRGNKNDE